MSEATARSGSNVALAGVLTVLCSRQFIIVKGCGPQRRRLSGSRKQSQTCGRVLRI